MSKKYRENFRFCHVIRLMRKEYGLTLEALAERANLNEKYVGRVERGESCLTFKTFACICNGFEINMTSFALKMENNRHCCKKEVLHMGKEAFNERFETIIKKALYQSLIEIRREKRLTQIELANFANINKTYYCFIERGYSNPTLKKLLKLCDALGISFFDILSCVEIKLSHL